MKQITIILICLLFIMIIIFPTGVIVSACFGYTFELFNVPAVSIIIALLSVCTVVFSLIYEDAVKSKAIRAVLAILPILSLVNVVFYSFDHSTVLAIVCLFVSVGCCCFLSAKHGKPLTLKITALVLSGLMFMPPISFVFLPLVFFGGFAQNTVVQTVESPNGKYIAEVVDSDQGALGGDTLVDVYEQSEINAIVFKLEKKPKNVYYGDWGEYEKMEIYWKDDGCLVINSVEHEIE